MGKRKSYHDKGRVRSQSEYDQEIELRNLYHEAFNREECCFEETVEALVILIGFSTEMAKRRVSEWKSEDKGYIPESDNARKKRWKRRQALEERFLKRLLTNDNFKELKSQQQTSKSLWDSYRLSSIKSGRKYD